MVWRARPQQASEAWHGCTWTRLGVLGLSLNHLGLHFLPSVFSSNSPRWWEEWGQACIYPGIFQKIWILTISLLSYLRPSCGNDCSLRINASLQSPWVNSENSWWGLSNNQEKKLALTHTNASGTLLPSASQEAQKGTPFSWLRTVTE